ncbi:MAG: glycoside hydrolase family 97 protein [Terrimonas sp.]|nr:glycoside hydrolase family 97 protein [Terrimonas sp.]
MDLLNYFIRGSFLFLQLILIKSIVAQEPVSLASPDQSVQVNIRFENGRLYYQVTKQKEIIIDRSLLGIVMEQDNFSEHLKWVNSSALTRVKETYHTRNAKKSTIAFQANRQTFSVAAASGHRMDIIFSVSDDGVAFRYFFPWVNGSSSTITKELSSFNFIAGTRAWLQPMSQAKTGWEHCHPSYEENYLQDIPVGTVSPLHAGWVYPSLFKYRDNWILISETGLDGNYCGTRLVNDSASTKYSIGFPDPREVFTGGGYLPVNTKPWYTPWRIITMGRLNTIMESTLGTDLAPAPAAPDLSYIKPGKASWSWINSKDDNITYEEQKKYIDYASDMHWQYCLIDVNWDTKIGYEKIRELATYAAQKKVGLILWYNSAGDWNTVQYHPKDLLLTKESREREFQRIHEMGIKGVKIDFFGGDGQSMIQYYIDILQDAARYKLMVNFHGATLPRGWAKTYPQLMSAEAVYGMEMVTFNQDAADAEAKHCSMLPFTRNIFDPMDFTPMNLYKLTHSNSQRKTTSAFELALSVIFLSGIQHYAESPEGMAHVPEYVKDFLRTLPDYWDDIKFIDGYPGNYVVLARRSGHKWYVAGINGENHTRSVNVDLSFLGSRNASLITEGKNGELFDKTELVYSKNNNTKLDMNARGGFIITAE